MSRLRLSKGPVPPARLPTEEEKTRGPRMSDVVNDFRNYLTGPEIEEYKRTRRLPKRSKCGGVVKLVQIWES